MASIFLCPLAVRLQTLLQFPISRQTRWCRHRSQCFCLRFLDFLFGIPTMLPVSVWGFLMFFSKHQSRCLPSWWSRQYDDSSSCNVHSNVFFGCGMLLHFSTVSLGWSIVIWGWVCDAVDEVSLTHYACSCSFSTLALTWVYRWALCLSTQFDRC